MIIQEDSRQQNGKHELKHEFWARHGDRVIRSMVIVGDYCIPPAVAIDTKANMEEIAQNIGGSADEHNRFISELKKAQDIGVSLYVLIENSEGIKSIEDVCRWYNPRLDYSPQAIDGKRLAKAMATIQKRYGCRFVFSSPEDAGQKVVDILEKHMAKEAFIIHADAWRTIQKLSLEQRGVLLSALMLYQLGEDLPEMDPVTELAFSFMSSQLDRDNEKYDRIIEKRKQAGKKGAEVRWHEDSKNSKCHQVIASYSHTDTVTDTDTDTVTDVDININNKKVYVPEKSETKTKRTVFRKPSLEEVREYCEERQNDVDPERFIAYYESNGWKVGRNNMKDWRAAVRTWERSGSSRKVDRAITAFYEEGEE